MPDTVWLKQRGRIETCTACGVSFTMQPGESTSVLIHRYTSWRERHADCGTEPTPEPAETETERPA